jgi:hypothetical protein
MPVFSRQSGGAFIRAAKKTAAVAAAVCGAIIVILILALGIFRLDKPLVRNAIQRELDRRTGAALRIGFLDYDLFPLKVRVAGVSLSAAGNWGEARIVIRSLGADGSLRRLLRGESPAFDDLRMEGIEVEVKLNALDDKEADLDSLLKRAFDALGRISRFEAKNIRVAVRLSGSEVELDLDSLRLRNSGGGRFGATMAAKRARIETLPPSLPAAWSGSLSVAVEMNTGSELKWAAGIEIDPSRIALPKGEFGIPGIRLQASGSFVPGERSLRISPFEVEFPGIASAGGDFYSSPGSGSSPKLNVEMKIDDPVRLLDLVEPWLPPEFREVSWEGKPVIVGKISAEIPTNGPPRFIGTAEIENAALDLPFPEGGSHIRGSVRIGFRGMPVQAEYSGLLSATLDSWERSGVRFRRLAARLPIEGDLETLRVSGATLSAGGMDLPAGRERISLENMTATTGKATVSLKSAVLDSFEARIPGWGEISGSGRIDKGTNGRVRVSFKSSRFGLAALRKRFPSFIPDKFAGWTFDGEAGMDLDVRGEILGTAPRDFSGKVDVSGAIFQDPGATIAGNGLAASCVFQGSLDPLTKKTEISGTLNCAAGETLWKDLYIDWSRSPITSEFRIAWDPSPGKLDIISSRTSLASAGELRAAGTILLLRPFSLRLATETVFDLAGLEAWTAALRNTKPSASLMGKGEGRFDIFIAESGYSVSGRLGLRECRFENAASGLSVTGIEADVPIRIVKGPAEESAGEFRSMDGGFLRMEGARTAWFALGPIRLALNPEMNAIRIKPFGFPVFGGRVELGETRLALDPERMGLTGDGSMTLENIDLAGIPAGSTPIQGTFRASFPAVRMTPRKIEFDGEGDLGVFGGRVNVRGISINEPFSAGRTILCDVSFAGIDLEKLTDVVPFGRVTGVLRGEIEDLAVSYGQPERFTLRLESVRTKGVRQTFSLKAVNNLSVISSGEKSLVPSRWWLRFVSKFSYSKIGIASTLRNDTFTLRGTIVEKGVEYLVKKSALFGISVVNRMPDKTISFKDMVQRLRRVGESPPGDEGKRPF